MSKSIRINKQRGYTVIPNGILPEGEISARAWGIYAYLLSRPDGWVIHVRQLQKVFKEGRDAIYAAMKQLRELGLLEMESYREPGQPPKKRYVMADMEELLNKSPDPDFQDTGNPDTGNQGLNHYLLNPENKTPKKDSPISTSEQSSDATHFTSNFASEMTRDKNDHLPKGAYKFLRQKLQDVGESIQQTGSFHHAHTQEVWGEFETYLEDATEHLPYGDAIVDLTQNGKWTVNEKVADQYEAGKELTTLLNVARSS